MSRSPSMRRLRVLSASADPALRQSRELLLREAGCEVETSLSKLHAHELLQSQHFDVLVFGNSLTANACNELARVFRGRNPSGRIIEIVSAPWDSPMNQPDSTAASPEEFLDAIRAFADRFPFLSK